MRVQLIRRNELDSARLQHVTDRVAAEEHKFNRGACSVWGDPICFESLLVVVERQSGNPIGILYARGPNNRMDVAWWLDSKYRGMKYGSEAIELLAQRLKAMGVTAIGPIKVDTFAGTYEGQSSA